MPNMEDRAKEDWLMEGHLPHDSAATTLPQPSEKATYITFPESCKMFKQHSQNAFTMKGFSHQRWRKEKGKPR